MVLESKVLDQEGNTLQLEFIVTHVQDVKFQAVTSDMYMCGASVFQIQVQSARCHSTSESTMDDDDDDGWMDIIISTKYQKLLKNDNLTYTCKISSVAFNKKNFTFRDDNSWHQIHHYNTPNFGNNHIFSFKFDITVEFDIVMTSSPFECLYDETNSTDFELHGEDGSIQMHKLILKVASPVMQTMLNGQWKEATEGKVKLDTSKAALEAFKEYIYLNKLPNTDAELEALILLGSYYMMTDLVQKCTVKLLNKINDNNFSSLLEFASKHKVKTLLAPILTMVKLGLIDIEEFTEDSLTDIRKSKIKSKIY